MRWGATCNGQAAPEPRLHWHINCLELWAVHLALRKFRPLRLSRTSTSWEVCDHTACHSLPAISSSGVTRSSSHCALFTSWGSSILWPTRSHNSSHSPESGSCTFPWLAHSWPRALRKYAFPPVSLLAQTLCKLREEEEQVLLVAPHWPTRTWFPELISLATAPPWCIPLRKDILSQGLVQIYGTPMCGSWTGCGRLERSTTGSGRDHNSGKSSFNKANLHTEMESVRELVFFSPRRPPKMHDWSSAFFPARKVGS